MKVIDPFLDGEGVWQGDSPGTMRKRFQCFGIKNSVDFCSNVTVYAPGEGSVFHNHPSSEELSYVISGSGVIQDMEQNVKAHIDQGKLILIDRGEIHRIFNDGRGAADRPSGLYGAHPHAGGLTCTQGNEEV